MKQQTLNLIPNISEYIIKITFKLDQPVLEMSSTHAKIKKKFAINYFESSISLKSIFIK